MFSSTIIPTINRSTLTRAVQSVLDQQFKEDEFEVIVVNDSGKPLPDMPWMHSPRMKVLNTNQRERSVARNTGAAIATGKYLNFLDDDDILLPGALLAFWKLAQEANGSIWLHGGYQTVDNDGQVIEEIFPEHRGNNFALLVASEGIPLQISMVDARHFHLAGTFDPLITGVEDRDLGRRLAMIGMISYTSAIVAQIRIGQVGSTTNWNIIAEGDRQSREKALSLPGALNRALVSAQTCRWHGKIMSSYWRGRLCRAYLASLMWNLRRGSLLPAVSRGFSFLVSAGYHWLVGNFWMGLRNIDFITRQSVNQGPNRVPTVASVFRQGSAKK